MIFSWLTRDTELQRNRWVLPGVYLNWGGLLMCTPEVLMTADRCRSGYWSRAIETHTNTGVTRKSEGAEFAVSREVLRLWS